MGSRDRIGIADRSLCRRRPHPERSSRRGQRRCSRKRGHPCRSGMATAIRATGGRAARRSVRTRLSASGDHSRLDAIPRAAPIQARGFVPEVPDAFEHDRTAVVDRVERRDPGGPVERAEAGGRWVSWRPLLSWTWVVRSQAAGGEGLGGGVGGDVGVAGVERQGELGAVELGDQVERGRPSGCRDGRPGACSRRRGRRRCPGRGRPARSGRAPGPRGARAACAGSERPPGWTTRQVPPAAASQSTHRFRSSTAARCGAGSGSPRSTRGARIVWPPQQPWALWIARPASATRRAERAGVGQGPPVGEDLEDARPRAGCARASSAARSTVGEAVGHHRPERAGESRLLSSWRR